MYKYFFNVLIEEKLKVEMMISLYLSGRSIILILWIS